MAHASHHSIQTQRRHHHLPVLPKDYSTLCGLVPCTRADTRSSHRLQTQLVRCSTWVRCLGLLPRRSDCITRRPLQHFETGDCMKFYQYFYKLEGSGATGVFLTIIILSTIMMFSGYCFYRYMVFTYMEGRILDLYRRLSGSYKDFFLPHDNEVSLKYLQWVLERYR